VQGGYGALFAIKAQSFLSYTSIAVQNCHGTENYQGTEKLNGGNGAVAVQTFTNLSWVQEHPDNYREQKP
jgi:hypothetical protein